MKTTLYLRVLNFLLLCLLLSVGARAQYGSDLGSEAISTLAWDHISSSSTATQSAGTIGLTTDNRMYVWGGNEGYTIHSKSWLETVGGAAAGPQFQVVPYYVPSPVGETIKKVRISTNAESNPLLPTYYAMSQSGKLYAWGANRGLLAAQWPVVPSPYTPTDTTKTIRKPMRLTVLPEDTFVDFEVSAWGNYWIAVSSTGKAYHIGVSSLGQTSNQFTALSNPVGVDAATFKYTNVWLFQNNSTSPTGPSIYLKGNNGKVYFIGAYNWTYACGVPSIAAYANMFISYPQRFWSSNSNEGTGGILTYAPIEVPFPAGEEIVDMMVGDISNNINNPYQNTYAISASGKGYVAGCWRRSNNHSNPETSAASFQVLVPLKSVPPSSDLLILLDGSASFRDSIFILTKFTEIALPLGATKVIDILNVTRSRVSSGTLAVFDNNRVYWSGVVSSSNEWGLVFSGNFLSLNSKPDYFPSPCLDIGSAVSLSPYSWTYESINFKGTKKLINIESISDLGMFIISKAGRGYFIGRQHAHAGLGKVSSGSNAVTGFGGRYHFFPTPIANEQLLDCQTSAGTGGPLGEPVTTPGVGTIDCSKTKLYPAPVAGVPSQVSLIVTVNVTTVGDFSPITVSGSGMSLPSDFSSVSATTTGVQTFHIPLNYDGTALTNAFQFTVGSAGSCSADLTQKPNKQVTNVWSLTNCSTVTPGVLSK